MKQKIKVIILVLIAVNLFCGIVDAAIVVKCYQPHDFTFKADTPVENPYQVGQVEAPANWGDAPLVFYLRSNN